MFDTILILSVLIFCIIAVIYTFVQAINIRKKYYTDYLRRKQNEEN